MNLELEGKRALVTGSSAGLGETIARLLAAEGARVVVHGRNEARTRAVAASIGADAVLGDLATDEGADEVAKVAGHVDILVNNAGAYPHHTWADATPGRWAQTYQTNVISGVRMIQRLVPGMRARGWGRIITIGGGLATQPIAGLPDYNASLAARHNLAVSLARELGGTGVTSNVVAPGAIRVAALETVFLHMARERGWGSTWEEIEPRVVNEVAPNDLGRFGRPEEVAAAVAYLASPLAAYVSGATLRVDGGAIRGV
ncbi:SDR family NAD(P)-dependent oxidoreductase [Nannocystis radixulma]|uniref:SDR family oxidoreductase n=1 Tax=Nannocystis radixulma TaxID=2995305 RepID=A0ABT5AYY9_9BACT|nr:SDR family oxidoreductase [Nannocystis radixulma]